jgi:hypothetical protein
MTRAPRLALALAGILAATVRADDTAAPTGPDHRLAPDDPGWGELAGDLRRQASVTADFTEERWFPFKRTPTVLHGEVRVSAEHGLSLHYLDPGEQIVIIDERGSLLRSPAGDRAPPADPRSGAANLALLHLLRLDLGLLARDFELYGQRTGAAWEIVLVPLDDDLRRALGQIAVQGEGAAVRRIELRRSAAQRVEITIMAPRSTGAFTAEEIRRFFR